MSSSVAATQSNVNGAAGSASSNPTAPRAQLKMSTKGPDGNRKQAASPVDGASRKPPPQKAWTQGTNPITQRSANINNSNGAPNTPKASQHSATVFGDPMRHLSDRMMYLLASLTGLPGFITLKNGDKYTGVLSGTSLDPTEMRYVFKMVKRVPAADTQVNGTSESADDYVGVGDNHVMSFDMGDVADFNVDNVVLDKTQAKGQNGSSSFRTDTDISGHMAIRERNLQKWVPSADTDTNMSLEGSGSMAQWDQFSTNEQLTGRKSDYDENLYTTTIDRSNPQYAERAARAERIAREIEQSNALNSHVLEERNVNASDEKGGDEEDKYSGVRRDFPPLQSGQPNKYTPPARRAPTGQATVPGAPVDPAIISSQVARPDSNAAATTLRTASPVVAQEPTKPESAPKTEVSVASKADAPNESASKSGVKPAAENTPAAERMQKPNNTLKSGLAGITSRKPSGQPDNATANVEQNVLDSFKQFASTEKLRMTERQRVLNRESKAVKLNDLRKFAQNFKLNTPVPTDLVPILSKDEDKQQLIVEKALKAVQEVKSTPPKPAPATMDSKSASRTGTAKADVAHQSPSGPSERQQNQRSRPGQNQYQSSSMRDRPNHNQNMNQGPPRNHGLLSTRLQLNQQQHHKQSGIPYNGVPVPQPIPVQDMRIPPPTGPSGSAAGVPAPNSGAASRFNVRAHEFKPNPAANTFLPGTNPSTNSSSPRPDSASRPEPIRKPTTSFFGSQRPTVQPLDFKESFNPITRFQKDDQDYSGNGGIQPPFRTPPTWDFPETNNDKGYIQMFEHSAAPTPISAPHNMMGNGPMPHQHQLPPHLQGQMPQGQTPHHTPRGPPVQPHHGQGPHHFEAPHMQYSHSQNSMQPSPRPMPSYMYGSQPQHMPGFPQQVPMQHYGMSPGMPHVPGRGGQGGPQFANPPGPGMGGQMMTNNPSNGPFMGMPANPQMPMYNPATGPGYHQYPGQMPTGPANGFPSPRPGAPMMSHQGSQQGHQQPVVYMPHGQPQMFTQAPPGSMTPMRGPYPQPHQGHYGSPHQHHPFPQQQAHRGTPSGSYSQPMMQQHSMPPQAPPTGPANNHGPEGNEEGK